MLSRRPLRRLEFDADYPEQCQGDVLQRVRRQRVALEPRRQPTTAGGDAAVYEHFLVRAPPDEVAPAHHVVDRGATGGCDQSPYHEA